MSVEVWQSPRKIEADRVSYCRQRFDWYMNEVDEGRLDEETAMAALRDELAYVDSLDEPND